MKSLSPSVIFSSSSSEKTKGCWLLLSTASVSMNSNFFSKLKKNHYPETIVLKLALSVTIICNLLNLLKIQLLPVTPLKITLLRISVFYLHPNVGIKLSNCIEIHQPDPCIFKINYFGLLIIYNLSIASNRYKTIANRILTTEVINNTFLIKIIKSFVLEKIYRIVHDWTTSENIDW